MSARASGAIRNRARASHAANTLLMVAGASNRDSAGRDTDALI